MRQRRGFYDMNESVHRHDHCDRCGKKDCDCERGALVEEVVLSKDVQKHAEFLLPTAIGPLPTALLDLVTGLVPELVNITVTPNYNNIEQEVTVIKDKVINFGYIPATLNVEGALPAPLAGLTNIPIRIFFQEHTDCPGVCPGDQVMETDPVVEAEYDAPLLVTENGSTSINLLLFKAVLRTNITVIRQGIERDGKFVDLNPRRCEPTGMPRTINSPLDFESNTTPGGGGTVGATAANNNQTSNQNNTNGQ